MIEGRLASARVPWMMTTMMFTSMCWQTARWFGIDVFK